MAVRKRLRLKKKVFILRSKNSNIINYPHYIRYQILFQQFLLSLYMKYKQTYQAQHMHHIPPQNFYPAFISNFKFILPFLYTLQQYLMNDKSSLLLGDVEQIKLVSVSYFKLMYIMIN